MINDKLNAFYQGICNRLPFVKVVRLIGLMYKLRLKTFALFIGWTLQYSNKFNFSGKCTEVTDKHFSCNLNFNRAHPKIMARD